MTSTTPSRPRTWIRDHPLTTFFALAFGFTWAVWVPRALDSRGVIDAPWAVELGYVWSWMPAVAAVLAAVLVGGRPGLREWASRLVRWRVGWRWYLVALLGPAVFWVVVGGVAAVLGLGAGMGPRVLDLGTSAVLVFAALLLTDGLGEEPGWRGYALPRWIARHGALTASVGLGAVWALWHLPLMVTVGSTMDGSPFAYHLLDFSVSAVIYTWLFLRSRGSVLPVIVLHASMNLWTPAAVPAGTLGQLATVLVAKMLVVAAVLVVGLTPTSPSSAVGAAPSPRGLRPSGPACRLDTTAGPAAAPARPSWSSRHGRDADGAAPCATRGAPHLRGGMTGPA